jgi:hypothetical protein
VSDYSFEIGRIVAAASTSIVVDMEVYAEGM